MDVITERNKICKPVVINRFYFILSSGINAYQKQIKVISITSENIYRLLHGVFDPSPDLSPSRRYQPEPEGRGLIRSEG